MHGNTTSDRCTSCLALLWPTEVGRQGCLRCQRAAEDRLVRLSGRTGLYAALSEALVPSRNVGDGIAVSGTRTPSAGINLTALELQSSNSGIVATLWSWVRDWYDVQGRPVPAVSGTTGQELLDAAAVILRANLPWAAASHPAWQEFASELETVVAACRRAGGEWRNPRPVVGTCTNQLEDGQTCGGALRYDPATKGTRCRACKTTAPADWQAIRRSLADQGA